MKMYKETLRRLLPVGLPLAIVTVLYTVITQGQNCFGAYTINISQYAQDLNPVLVYYVFTAILFAVYGFSFLFKRPVSDLYHSLPVKRMDLYLSMTLATATWMGGTILVNILTSYAMLLISGCPFVPAYIPITILFYFVASMLVYAAAAIGCALSGTLLTALASTGLVLFLPRFVQFIIARGIVAKVPIVGWHDLGIFLSPVTNIATGLVVMQTRPFFSNLLFKMPNILYSILPMTVGLVLAAWLFIRRSSETADHGAGRKVWAIATACLLSLVALTLITVDEKPLLSMYGISLTAIALLIFILYQFIALRSLKQVLKSLPCFLLTVALAFGVSFGISTLSHQMLNTTPTAEEIASVTFRGYDGRNSRPEYSTYLISKIDFTAENLKKYVSNSLSDAVDEINTPDMFGYGSYSQYQVVEPITLHLKDGRNIDRTIKFRDVNALNKLRSEDSSYQSALLTFPAPESIQYLQLDRTISKTETQEIWNSYVTEAQALKQVTEEYYRNVTLPLDSVGNTVATGSEQKVANLHYHSYVGDQLFSGYRTVRIGLPKTAALVMNAYNAHTRKDMLPKLKEAIQHMSSPLMLENDNFSLSLSCFNVPWGTNSTRTADMNMYVSGYSKTDDPYIGTYINFSNRLYTLLSHGNLTNDPTGLFICLNWNEYDSSNNESTEYPNCFMSFNDADSQALHSLMTEWNTAFNNPN